MRVLHFITMLTVGLTGIVLTACNGEDPEKRTPERHELSAVMEDNIWKIVDDEDPDKERIEVARGDTVVWQAPKESAIYFQFMDDRLTGEFTAVANRGERLSLTIGEEAKEGDNPYAVFVINGRTYARGESPPRMIIKK